MVKKTDTKQSKANTKEPAGDTKQAKPASKASTKKPAANKKTPAKSKAKSKKAPAKAKSKAKKPAAKETKKTEKEEPNPLLLIDPKKKRGRPPKTPTPKILEQVKDLASRGLHDKEIAAGIGWHPSFFSEQKTKFNELNEAIEEGRAIARANMINAVYEAGLKGNIHAAKYWLNNKDPENWRDRKEVGVETITPREVTDEELDEMDDAELERISNSENVVLIGGAKK